jgi:hypothetical protein
MSAWVIGVAYGQTNHIESNRPGTSLTLRLVKVEGKVVPVLN